MPAEAAPPLSAPPGVKIVPPSTPPKAPPAPTREIRLGAPSSPAIDRGPDRDPPKPGSPRDRLSQSLRQKAGLQPEAQPPTETPPSSSPQPGEVATPPPGQSPETEPEKGQITPPTSTPTAPTTEKSTKVNPWKLVEQYKAKTGELEMKLAEAAKIPETKQKEFLTRIEQLEKRNTELENEMRFRDYSQTDDFKEKYDQPYHKAWERAVSEMAELVVADPSTGAQRQVTAQDVMDLCNLPLAKAREYANEVYGDFADDMMAHRKEIRTLFQAREAALKEAKEQGIKRDAERQQILQKNTAEMQELIKSTWEKANTEMTTHEKYGKFFAPTEGDQDGNQRLAKGFELVDRAYSENPLDPRLTPEQRASVVRRHAAVRNRAAAFGRLVAMNSSLESRLAELTKELEQYKGSTPPTAGSSPASAPPGNGVTAHDQVFGALRKLAK